MALAKDVQKNTANNVYENARPCLRKKNGNYHVIYFYLTGSQVNDMFSCEEKMTTEVNQILLGLQNDGYEILDVQLRPTFEDASLSILKRKVFLLSINYR